MRPVLTALILFTLGAVGSALAQASKDIDRSDVNAKEPEPPPIVFFLAKGEPGACGPGCAEWIAADGTIDRGASQRLRALLERTDRRALPVYFHSPGGSVSGAIEIGRLMRARGLKAGVGRTIPQGCDPLQEREAACDALKRSGRELAAELRTIRTLCNSSCVYALIGARTREVTAGARIGVHTIALGRFDRSGQVKASKEPKSSTELAALKAANGELERYIVGMGIGRGLFEAAAAVEHDRLRYISRDEIARLGIDPREFHESRWTLDEGPPGPLAVLKFATEARGEPKQYRMARIRLTCARNRNLQFEFSRELADIDRPVSIAVTAQGGDVVLPPRRGKPILGYNDIEMEDRYTRVPLAFFQDAAGGDTITLTEAPDTATLDKPPHRLTLSTVGLKGAIEKLAEKCR